jgi:multicomponent Na+:H+ antiporter subunit G
MILTDLLQGMLLLAGVGFFLVGTLGILRFPDVYTRVHALTKADNLGLGLIVFGLLLGAESVPVALKLLLIWGLALIASAAAGYLVARAARRRGVKPGRQGPEEAPDALAGSAAGPDPGGDRGLGPDRPGHVPRGDHVHRLWSADVRRLGSAPCTGHRSG